MLFFPPFLGGVLFDPGVLQKGLLPFVVFCLASSSTYVFNDIRDSDSDRLHPLKQNRPIASGSVPISQAAFTCVALFIVSILLSLAMPISFSAYLLAYLTLSFAYSFGLKDQPVFDIFCIALVFLYLPFFKKKIGISSF